MTKKTLIILVIILGLILTVGYISTPKLMAVKIAAYEQEGNQENAVILKERLIRFFPGSEEARWEVYSLIDRLLEKEERVMIGPDFTSGGGAEEDILVPAEKVIVYLLKVTKAQKEAMWKYNMYEKLGEVYHSQGSFSAAEENYLIAAKGFEAVDGNFRAAETNIRLVNLYLETGEQEKALSLIEESSKKYADLYIDEFLSKKGDLFFQQGDYQKAEECYRKALEEAKKDWDEFQAHRSDQEESINATLDQQPVYRHSKSQMELIRNLKTKGDEAKGSVKGEILKGNIPMSNVLVYLINEKKYDGRMNHLEGIQESSAFKTDMKGEFKFDNVAPGRYFLVLGLLPEDLNGLGRFNGLKAFTVEEDQTKELRYVFQPKAKILEPTGQNTFNAGESLKIAWEEVPGAKSYNLHITLKLENGYASQVYRQNLRGNSYIFNPQGMALREMNFVTWGNEYVLGPSAILGSFYPGAEIFFVVEALDHEDRTISDSEGYVLEPCGNYPSIQVGETNPLSIGDKLVLEKKYSGAIEAYLKGLEEKPNDPHILLSLARLYNYGWTEETADLGKAVNYYEELLKVNRDRFIVQAAAGANNQAGNYETALKLYEEIENEMSKSIFWFHQMGELYFMTGNTEKAIEYYQRYLNKEKEFIDLGPVIAYLYQDDVPGALKLLKENSYSERVRYNSERETEKPADINQLINNLERYHNGVHSALNKEDFKKYLWEIMSINGSNRFEKVQAFQAKIKSWGEKDVLVFVLEELAKDRL
ncbi:tetratricopeptide repeat protein [Dehalobacterium formicoaceticum]|uniref:Tetratricopeptide repeat protein n=1 Tax=Dehalobacterium formicoaceticum TaxID=51515 RepID=A0ABT1Y6C7_9FIRM|nr:tetratricopeptide repeat protein [Dehalobacterium formicoaceticum]MCR6546440.1 tetratricopeptide repeat protein [Dehalobacterium formicoaceticum]